MVSWHWIKENPINTALVTSAGLLAVVTLFLMWPTTSSQLTVGVETTSQPLSLALRSLSGLEPQLLADAGLELVDEGNAITAKKSSSKKYDAKVVKPVNLNKASLADLQFLPNVGSKMAQRILAYRKKIGQFSAVEQLLDVQGIGPKKLAKMKPYCLL